MRRVVPPLGALAFGALASAAFAPVRAPWLFVLALTGLFWLLKKDARPSWRGRSRTTTLFGIGLFAPGIWWMNAISPAAWVALLLAQLFFFWLLGIGLHRVLEQRWWVVSVAAIWTLVEITRALAPFKGFPWLRLAHTSLDTTLAPWVRLLGLPGTTMLMALLAALLTAGLLRWDWRPLLVTSLLLVVSGFLPTGLAGEGSPLTVAAVQGNTPGPFSSWPRGKILDLHLTETTRLEESIDLVIWPENASDVDVRKDPGVRHRVMQASLGVDAPILVGAILDGPDEHTALNASFIVDADGPHEQQYLKRFIVPWGEYVPLRDLLGKFVPRFDREIPRDLVAGDAPGSIEAARTRVGVVICWDVAHDRAVREAIGAGGEFIAVQTSNASFADFGSGIQPEQQWDISRLRAIETGRWVVVASTNGVSGIVDPTGRVVERLTPRMAATAVATIELTDSSTPSAFLAVPTSALIVLAALGGLAVGSRRNTREAS